MQRETYNKLKNALRSSEVTNSRINLRDFFVGDTDFSDKDKLEFLEIVTGTTIVYANELSFFKTSDKIVDRTGNGLYERIEWLEANGYVKDGEGNYIHPQSDYGEANYHGLDPVRRHIGTGERDYSYNPMHSCIGTMGASKPTDLYLGIEHEVGFKDIPGFNTIVKNLFKTLGEKYTVKYDSSIPNGSETCSIPMTYAEHLKFMNKTRMKQLSTDGCRKTSLTNCGIHIHLRRTAFTDEAAARFIAIMSASKNKKFLTKFAGRSTSYSDGYAEIKFGQKGRTQKYSALNIHGNGQTFEIRIFASTLDHDEWTSNLQFCVSMHEYCMQDSVITDSMGNYLKWMQRSANCKRYPQLYTRLKGLVGTYQPKLFLYGNLVTVGKVAPKAILTQESQRIVGEKYYAQIRKDAIAKRTYRDDMVKRRVEIKEALRLARTARTTHKNLAHKLTQAILSGDTTAVVAIEAEVMAVPMFEPMHVQGIQVTHTPIWV